MMNDDDSDADEATVARRQIALAFIQSIQTRDEIMANMASAASPQENIVDEIPENYATLAPMPLAAPMQDVFIDSQTIHRKDAVDFLKNIVLAPSDQVDAQISEVAGVSSSVPPPLTILPPLETSGRDKIDTGTMMTPRFRKTSCMSLYHYEFFNLASY